jgi:hypothetical protein
VNCGPRSNFLYFVTPFYYYSLCLLSCITIILLPLDTLNPLFTANRWDWQPHRKLGVKYLFVLCAGFTLLLGEDTPTSSLSGALVRSVTKLTSITFWSLAFSYWFDKPWFHNWGKTCYCAYHTFLLGFPTGCTYKPSKGGVRRWARWPHHLVAWQGLGRAALWCGWPLAPLRPCFWNPSCVGKNMNFGFCFI